MNGRAQTKFERFLIDAALKKFPNAHAERAAGSGVGKNAVCDVVFINEGKPYLIEIKATKFVKFCFSGEQRENLLRTAAKCSAVPLLAVRFKRRNWVVVNLLERDNWTVHSDEKTLWELEECYLKK